ncbi:MAG: diguanylate phosphodiesterase [Blastocatellia bacterium AA13]|nr:MAG: diguanylate phosphodiesterase [Blastocatellia bacterium AA13]
MAEKPEEILKLFSKSEELLDMFRKGKAFTEELMYENERLRYRIVQLEKEKIDLSDTLMREIERFRLENSQLSGKVEFLDSRFQEIEAENKDFALRYVEVEEQNESLANLYVASYRLHSTLDPVEVVQCINEILMNMIGSEEFGLFVVDEETNELVLAGYEGEIAQRLERGRVSFGEGLEGMVAQTGEPFFTEDAGDRGEVCAAIPLKIKERVVGVIAIYRLLGHKMGLSGLDHKLLELLAGHAATALVSSKLYAAADRKLKTIEGFMSLLRVK